MSYTGKLSPLLDRSFDGSEKAHLEAFLASSIYQYQHRLFSQFN